MRARRLLLAALLLVGCGVVDASPAPPKPNVVIAPALPTASYSPSFPGDTTFPVTLASAQSYFPSLTSLRAWTFQETSGNIIEQVSGGPSLIPSGTPHYGMWTPLAHGHTHVGQYSDSDYFTTATAAALDPAGASFTCLLWIRPEFVYTTQGYIVDALDSVGHGFRLFMNKTFGASQGTLEAVVRDGSTSITVTTTQSSYQWGAWIPVAVVYDAGAKTAHLITAEEDATASNGAFVNANLVNGSTSTVGIFRGLNTSLQGGFAYLAFGAGTITLAQLQAYSANWYGTSTGLTSTSASGSSIEATTLDCRDLIFGCRTITWPRNSVPREWSINGREAWATGHSGTNVLASSERLTAGAWSTVGSPTLTPFAAEAPSGSFTATEINKASTGAAVGVHQLTGPYYTSTATASVFLKADTPHTATVRVVGSHNNTFDTSVAVAVTTAWQQVVIPFPGLNGSDYTQFDLYVYPTTSANDSTTGYVYAWGAQVAGPGMPYVPSGSVASVNGGPSVIGGTVPWAHVSSGWVEVALVPQIVPALPFVFSLLNGDSTGGGGLNFGTQSGTSSIGVRVDVYPAGDAQSRFWDNRGVVAVGQRIDAAGTWGAGDIDVCVDGECQQVFYPNDINEGNSQPMPVFINGSFTLGYDPTHSGSGIASLDYERIAFGNGKLNRNQVRALSTSAGAARKFRVFALGDSITGFQDGYHAELALDLGPNALVANHGVSGDRTDQMQARLTPLLSDGNASGWTHLTLLGGINNLMFFGWVPADVEASLQAMYSQAHALGIKTIALTILPCAGSLAINGGPWGTSCSTTVQGYITQINTWITTQARDLDYVVDTYSLVQDPMKPGWMLASISIDGLHPNATGSTLIGDYVFAKAYGGVQLARLEPPAHHRRLFQRSRWAGRDAIDDRRRRAAA